MEASRSQKRDEKGEHCAGHSKAKDVKISKKHVEGREEKPTLTAGGPAAAKGSEGMGSSRGETRGAPVHWEHQGKDTSNLISLALLQMSSSQLEKVVSFHSASPLPQKYLSLQERHVQESERGRGEGREGESSELMLDSCQSQRRG